MNRLAILLVLTLVGCLKDDVHFADSGDSSDTGTLEEVGQTTAVVTTIAESPQSVQATSSTHPETTSHKGNSLFWLCMSILYLRIYIYITL